VTTSQPLWPLRPRDGLKQGDKHCNCEQKEMEAESCSSREPLGIFEALPRKSESVRKQAPTANARIGAGASDLTDF
jgi:hypothetical protein